MRMRIEDSGLSMDQWEWGLRMNLINKKGRWIVLIINFFNGWGKISIKEKENMIKFENEIDGLIQVRIIYDEKGWLKTKKDYSGLGRMNKDDLGQIRMI